MHGPSPTYKPAPTTPMKRGAGILPIAASTGRMLLALRSNLVEQPGTWGVAGGYVGVDEDDEAAAWREAAEELGALPDMHITGEITYIGSGVRYTVYVASVADEWNPVLDPENDDFAWMTLADALMTRLHRETREVLVRLGSISELRGALSA